MRRKDREVKGFEDIIKIMEKCDVCRIALNNDGYPYILPLNFGLKVEGEKYEALMILMRHYHKEDFPFNKAVIPATTVFKLVVENMTGKIRPKKNRG